MLAWYAPAVAIGAAGAIFFPELRTGDRRYDLFEQVHGYLTLISFLYVAIVAVTRFFYAIARKLPQDDGARGFEVMQRTELLKQTTTGGSDDQHTHAL